MLKRWPSMICALLLFAILVTHADDTVKDPEQAFAYKLVVEQSELVVGEPVYLFLHVTNVGAEEKRWSAYGRPQVSIDGEHYYDTFAMDHGDLPSKKLKPGETMVTRFPILFDGTPEDLYLKERNPWYTFKMNQLPGLAVSPVPASSRGSVQFPVTGEYHLRLAMQVSNDEPEPHFYQTAADTKIKVISGRKVDQLAAASIDETWSKAVGKANDTWGVREIYPGITDMLAKHPESKLAEYAEIWIEKHIYFRGMVYLRYTPEFRVAEFERIMQPDLASNRSLLSHQVWLTICQLQAMGDYYQLTKKTGLDVAADTLIERAKIVTQQADDAGVLDDDTRQKIASAIVNLQNSVKLWLIEQKEAATPRPPATDQNFTF